MRSRERLVAVLESVNRKVVGWNTRENCDYIAGALNREAIPSIGQAMDLARYLIDRSDSAHIRELAAEALHYLNEDASHG